MFFAVYDLDDNNIGTFENYEELAKFFNKTTNSMRSSYNRFKKGIITEVRRKHDETKYKIYKYKREEI